MVSEPDVPDRLTVQSLAADIIGGVSLAAKYLRNEQRHLIKLVDHRLRSSAMPVFALFPCALPISWPTSSSYVQYLVCLSLVSSGSSILIAPQSLTCPPGSQRDTYGRLRIPCLGMAMSYASLLMSFVSLHRKLFTVANRS